MHAVISTPKLKKITLFQIHNPQKPLKVLASGEVSTELRH
jgi:hypothetical protein